ncbi:MAG: hypothetical protein PHE25_05305 [Candidatus Gracilibacteria bacterium]|nr:hypothetical protein [Candidatus Gracilibacteria bacterium]
MQDIKIWEEKIKEKRYKIKFREFVKELGSWLVLNLYKNKGKICRYPETERIKKLGDNFWEDAPNLGQEYNISEDFFYNMKSLYDTIPFQYLYHIGKSENCDFSDVMLLGKNVYLGFTVMNTVENIAYSAFCYPYITDVYNSFMVSFHSSNVYMSAGITNSQNVFYSKYIADSYGVYFSSNLIGCQECIGCNDLQNKSYCIGNKQYSKEEYTKKKEDTLKDKNSFLSFYKHISTRKATNIGSENVSGNSIIKSSNIENGGCIANMHNGYNILIGDGGEGTTNHVYDAIDIGHTTNHIYAGVGIGDASSYIYCSSQITGSNKIYYSYFLDKCSYCIGCIGLKNKSFCILNKQYSKEEWYELANKIFSQMEADGILGDFFPGELNPFYFNDTMAYLIDDSFTKEEVEKEGYMWRDEKIKVDIPEGAEIIYTKPVGNDFNRSEKGNENIHSLQDYQGFDSNGNWFINPEIMKKVIQDENGNVYKIVPMEYEFLMKHGLPLPEIHWLDRIKLGFKFK